MMNTAANLLQDLRNNKAMKEIIKKQLPSIIITVALLISEIIFVYLLSATSLLSLRWMLLCGVLLLALTAGVYFLTRSFKHKVRSIIGCVLALIIFVTECFGGYYVLHGASTLNEVATPKVEFAEIGVYVRTDDPATELAHITDYPFGILEQLDRANTDLALVSLRDSLSKEPATTQYAGISELLDALLKDETDAILLNTAFLELIEETEGYEDYFENIRELCTIRVEEQSGSEVDTDAILPEKDDNTFTLYITGIDTRSSEISRKSRTDVNILATVNTETGQIVLVSTPRDYFVPLSISDGIPDKLSHSGVYGTQVSIDTIEMIYDIEIDYYFKVNFTGFKDIIDALGGITVDSDMSFKAGSYSFKKGINELDGAAALAFSRERKSIGGDRQRGRHQLAVVKAVINKVVSPALLTNYTAILDSVKDSFETSMPYDEIARLVRLQLDRGTKWNIVSYSTDGKGASKKPYSLSQRAYVLIPDETTIAEAKRLMEQVRKGEVPVLSK